MLLLRLATTSRDRLRWLTGREVRLRLDGPPTAPLRRQQVRLPGVLVSSSSPAREPRKDPAEKLLLHREALLRLGSGRARGGGRFEIYCSITIILLLLLLLRKCTVIRTKSDHQKYATVPITNTKQRQPK